MAKILRASGMDVRHEDMGTDGSVSCFLAVDDFFYHGRHHDRLAICDFDVRMHQTRAPLETIGSLAGFDKTWFWHWQEKHTGIRWEAGPLDRAARFYLRWHSILEEQPFDLRYAIEKLPETWGDIRGLLPTLPECPPPIPRNIGESDHPVVAWDDVKSLDVPLYDDLREMAERYGYEA